MPDINTGEPNAVDAAFQLLTAVANFGFAAYGVGSDLVESGGHLTTSQYQAGAGMVLGSAANVWNTYDRLYGDDGSDQIQGSTVDDLSRTVGAGASAVLGGVPDRPKSGVSGTAILIAVAAALYFGSR